MSNDNLFYKKHYIWEKINEETKEKIFKVADDYKKFIDASKTERLSVKEIDG